jgi:hypothetical protein
MRRREEPRIPDAVLDQLLAGADPNRVFDANGLLDDLKKALPERVRSADNRCSFKLRLIGRRSGAMLRWDFRKGISL